MPGDVTLESGIVLNPGKPPAGFLRRVFPLPYKIGTLNAKVTTENSLSFELENTTAAKDFTVEVTSGFNPSQATTLNSFGESCYLGLSVKHSEQYVAGSVGLRTCFKNDNLIRPPIVDGSLSVGYKGASVGGSASFDTSTSTVTASGAGVEYAFNSDLTVSAFCRDEKKEKPEPVTATVAASYKIDSKTELGLGVDLKGPENKEDGIFSNLGGVFSLALKFNIDPATNLKLRYSSSNKVIANLDYTFADPKAKVALACAVDPRTKSLKGAEWGVNVTLGDY
jgi:hypothetical protein